MNLLYTNPVLACYANDNDALIPELWAQEGLAILEENMVMAQLVHRDFSMEVASFGDVVNTRRPSSFTAKRKTDADSVVNQDAVATNVQVPLDQHVYVTFTIKDGEASKSFQDLVELYLTPAAQEIASSVDRILCGQVHEFLTNNVGSLMEMTGTNAKSYLLQAREKMNVNKAYAGGRNMVLSPESETDLLETELFVSAEKRGDDGTALREASLGRVFGFDTYMDQNVPSVTIANTDNAAGVINGGEPLGETTCAVTILAYQVQDGEFVWFEGEGKPHEVASATDDGTNTSEIVLVDGLTAAIADTDIVYAFKKCDVDGLYASGYAKGIGLDLSDAVMTEPPQVGQLLAFGTGVSRHTYTIIAIAVDPDDATRHLAWLDRPLEAQVADNAVAYPGPSGSFNFGFHRNALALVSRPLALPNTALGVRSAVGAYNDVTMRVSMQYDISAQGTVVTADLLCGVATLDTNLGCILLG
jgi:hypothetical protein